MKGEPICQKCEHISACVYVAEGSCYECPVIQVCSGEIDFMTTEDFAKLRILNSSLYDEVIDTIESKEDETVLGIGGYR